MALALQRIWERTIEEMSSEVSKKTVSDGACMMFCGRVFHSREAATAHT